MTPNASKGCPLFIEEAWTLPRLRAFLHTVGAAHLSVALFGFGSADRTSPIALLSLFGPFLWRLDLRRASIVCPRESVVSYDYRKLRRVR